MPPSASGIAAAPHFFILLAAALWGIGSRGWAQDRGKTGTAEKSSKSAEAAVPASESAEAAGAPSKKDFPWDKGPKEIDVSKYPPEMQARYKIFSQKCSKCHTLARPINAPLVLPEEWEAYVMKMTKKRRSGINTNVAREIIEFLQYDSSVRKKDLLEKKLKATEEEKEKAGTKPKKTAGGE